MGRLFLLAASAYLVGSLLVGFSREWVWALLLLLGAASIVLGALWSWRLAAMFSLMLCCLGLGQAVAAAEMARWHTLDETVRYQGEVTIIKREATKTWYQPLVVRPSVSLGSVSTDIAWRAPRTSELMPGDRVTLTCLLERPKNFDPRFDYAASLATRGIGYVCERADESLLLPGENSWRRRLAVMQAALRQAIVRLVPEPAAGLLQGLFLGGDDALPQMLIEDFRRAGLSHVVAVSGYNMTLVAFATLFVALSLGLWRRTATVLAMLAILAFLLLIDTSAASVRAALMAWIVCLAYFLGRPTQAYGALALAALGMTLENPAIVRYDVGFQLSFLATLALLVASPWLEQLARRKRFWWKFLLIPLSTFAIELAIAPVVAFHFGAVNLLGPIANTLVLPLIPLAMGLGFVLIVLGLAAPAFASLLSLPLWVLLMAIISAAEVIGGLSWSTFEGWYPGPGLLALWYIVLGVLMWYSRKFQYSYALRMDHPHRSH